MDFMRIFLRPIAIAACAAAACAQLFAEPPQGRERAPAGERAQASGSASAKGGASAKEGVSAKEGAPVKVCAVKIDGEISPPQLSILKRAVREAEESGAKVLLIDMDTPGGELHVALEMMKALSDFGATTACYVNPDAISAGSLIAAACDKIYFSPRGVMGAAEAVSADGSDIDESMSRKIISYLGAKVRSFNGGNSRRAQIIRAMNDPDFELEIAGKILKKKGELLSLTAKEAAETLEGAPVLSNGTAPNVAAAAAKAAGVGNPGEITLSFVKITQAEKLAKYASQVSPLIIGLGLFLIFMDLKSGGFGLLATIGLCAMLAVFAAANLSGIAGYEEAVVFGAGALMIIAELLFLPGAMFLAIPGAILAICALAWAMAGIIPDQGLEYNAANLAWGFAKLALSVPVALLLIAAFGGLVKKSPLWGSIILKPANPDARAPSPFDNLDARAQFAAASTSHSPEGFPSNSPGDSASDSDSGSASATGSNSGSTSGSSHSSNFSSSSASPAALVGVCITDLSPSGQIRIGDNTFDAVSQFGHIPRGTKVKVVAKKDFNLSVKKI